MCNHKGFLSQNCLFICDFNFNFVYSLCGWDGSMADAALWTDVRVNDLRIPEGQYLLADAGFGTSDTLMVPYRGVRCHLKEWRQANVILWSNLGHPILFLSASDIVCCSLSSVGFYLGFILK
jgi:hypothetical protein